MKVFKGRPVVAGMVETTALVTHGGFNTLASFQKSLLSVIRRQNAQIRIIRTCMASRWQVLHFVCHRPLVLLPAVWYCIVPMLWDVILPVCCFLSILILWQQRVQYCLQFGVIIQCLQLTVWEKSSWLQLRQGTRLKFTKTVQ